MSSNTKRCSTIELTEIEQSTVEQLAAKSQEAFILAIELYNRPSIRYRVEGCAFFLCNAWELLLKAYLVSKYGMSSIYYSDKGDRTLSLEECIKRVFTNENDPLRKNMDLLIGLRNTGTHFIVEEYEGIYLPVLQANVSNYDDKARELMGIDICDVIPENYLVLSVRRNELDISECRAKYPAEVIKRLVSANSDILSAVGDEGNRRIAQVYTVQLRTTKKEADLSFNVVGKDEADGSIAIVSKIVNPYDKYPYRTKAVVEIVNDKLSRAGIALMAGGQEKRFTKNDLQLFLSFYSMKGDERYSYNTSAPEETPRYMYSQQLVEDILTIIKGDPSGTIDRLKQELKTRKGSS